MSKYDIQIKGNELKNYLMKRFNLTEEEALKSMKEHNQKVED